MAFPKSQNPLDWLTQLWNIACGEKINLEQDAWLLGPIGEIGGISDRIVDSIAAKEGLEVFRNQADSGLVDDFEGFRFDAVDLNPRIQDFYRKTIHYDFDVWTQWQPVFGSFGYIVSKLFSQRVEQLNLPQNPLDTAWGMKSEIINLRKPAGELAHRVWFRRLKRTGEVVYSGIYSHCFLPSGEKCLKIIFPLPEGSATVIMKLQIDGKGNLTLESKGKESGDPGFYFIVKDREGTLWKHYLPSFHEKIHVYEDSEQTLRADHSMNLWGIKAYDLHYKINQRKHVHSASVSVK